MSARTPSGAAAVAATAQKFYCIGNAASVMVGAHAACASRVLQLCRKHACLCQGFVAHVLILHNPPDDAGRGFRRQNAPTEQELERAMPADNARQMHKINWGDETEIDFVITERGSLPVTTTA
jgi:hypothetical protein